MKMKKAMLMLVMGCLMLLSAFPVSAAVMWNSSSLDEVYNPVGNKYSYAPTVIQDGDTTHMWTCHNNVDGVIKDHIYYTKIENGNVVSSYSVLQAGGSGAWDSYHVCDPAVVQGQFQLNNETYQYAMFYLGNDVNASYHNQIGVAFAKTIEGPWVKYNQPVITYPNDGYWGVGQPSVTSVDGQGHLLLFYTQGDSVQTTGYRVEVNLSNMSQPSIGQPLQLTTAGLLDKNGAQDWLNNFEMVYDPTRDRFYAVRDQHPFPGTAPNYITENVQVVSIAGAHVWGGGGTWKVEAGLTSAQTGFARNHNAGILRSSYGTLPSPNSIDIYFTDSEAVPNLTGPAEYTYDIWKITGELNELDPVAYQDLSNATGHFIKAEQLSRNLNTNSLLLHGSVSSNRASVWIGYKVYDSKGLLLDAGTAYKGLVDEAGSFALPLLADLRADKSYRLQIYTMNARGVTTASGNVTMQLGI